MNAGAAPAPARLDHLVVAASDLDAGIAWCAATLGVAPDPGGRHARFGTHNRLLRLDTADGAPAYLEIIAIDPAAPAPAVPQRRWFDLDDPALQARLRRDGPRLIHWVVRVADAAAVLRGLAAQGHDAGALLAASRDTARGTLRWRIGVREDGRRLFGGALPTPIEWGDTHPADDLPPRGLALQALTLGHPDAPALAAALRACGLAGDDAVVAAEPAATPTLSARLLTPRGLVELG